MLTKLSLLKVVSDTSDIFMETGHEMIITKNFFLESGPDRSPGQDCLLVLDDNLDGLDI